MRNQKEKKRYGLMSFDEIDGNSSADAGNEPVLSFLTGPKENCEMSRESFKLRHKGVSHKEKSMRIAMYKNRLKSLVEVHDDETMVSNMILTGDLQGYEGYSDIKKVLTTGLYRNNKGINFRMNEKVSMGRVNQKVAYCTDGLNSNVFGHPDYQKYIVESRATSLEVHAEADEMLKNPLRTTKEEVQRENDLKRVNRQFEVITAFTGYLFSDGSNMVDKAFNAYNSL